MSIFPAYSSKHKNNIDKSDENDAGPSWLSNSTFKELQHYSDKRDLSESDDEDRKKPDSSVSSLSENSSGDGTPEKCSRKKKKKKKKHKSSKKIKNCCPPQSDIFYEDSNALVTSNKVPQIQLTKPTSNYQTSRKNKKKKKREKNRYFHHTINEDELELSNLNPHPMKLEQFLKQTEIFNQNLRNEPQNVEMWLSYIKLQDAGVGSIRGIKEKKMSILDKALEVNPASDRLLHEKMLIAESIYPLDKVAMEAKTIAAKFPKNMTGWLWLVNSSQYNLSKMTAPGVLLNYEKVLEGIHRVHNESEQFFDFLFLCGLFLRQCGLWEQLLVLLQLYLELCLSSSGSGKFNIQVELPHEEIKETEDCIITSGLPLGALWLRVERLREGVYFLPVEESPDPQRVVFQEDLTPLLFPVTHSSSSRLILSTLLLLKVPPLPLTHTFFRFTKFQEIPWFLDSVELILAATFSKGETPFLDIVPELLLGPQYLADNLGRFEFFNYINSIFDEIIANNPLENACFLVWQMRWWRWVYSFQEKDDSVKKYYLGLSKKKLKEHRDCLPLYIEYALLLDKCGDFDSSIKVLETAISLRDPPLLAGINYKRDLYFLYKTYIDLLIQRNLDLHREKLLKALIALGFGEPIKNISDVTPGMISKCKDRFTHFTTEVVIDIEDYPLVKLAEVMIPDYRASWLTCHAWFLFVAEEPRASLSFLLDTIEKLEKPTDSNEISGLNAILEGLYESLIDICIRYCSLNPGNNSELIKLTERAVKSFPNNAFFLNTVFSCKLSGLHWNKFTANILSSGSLLSSIFLYFMTHARYLSEDSLKPTASTRLLSLLQKLTTSHDRCPLLWRLLLQASCFKDSDEIKRTFYRSVEKCPWVKVLYFEAAKILPGDLAEIQDLIIEKELRLHITPEELEILRQDV